MQEISMERCIENVYRLAETRKIKITELAKAIGISRNGLARMRNGEGSLTLRHINLLAKELAVSPFVIMASCGEELTKYTELRMRMVERICEQTEQGKLSWEREPNTLFTGKAGKTLHPLTTKDTKGNIRAVSQFVYDDAGVNIYSCYRCQYNKKLTIYLARLQYLGMEGKMAFELYLYDGKKVKKVCHALEKINLTFMQVLRRLDNAIYKNHLPDEEDAELVEWLGEILKTE